MPSGFSAQQQGSRNPHQNPVRSHKGGYLRCPFNISSSYAELAARRVREDLAHGSNSGRSRVAVADKDGVMVSSSTGSLMDGDGTDADFTGRPWSRAGVGASMLSGKEKRTQQEQAELIYGRGTLAEDDSVVAPTGAVPVTGDASQENMFAVDVRDRAALQKVLPRAVREKVKRRRLDDFEKEHLPTGKRYRHVSAPVRANYLGEEEGEEHGVDSCSKGHMALLPHTRTHFSAQATDSCTNSVSPLPHCAGSKGRFGSGSNGASSRAERLSRSDSSNALAQRQPSPAPTSPPASKKPSSPKNRMQMLDALRASALMGKKSRR